MSSLRTALLAAALVIPAASAFAGEQYYANVTNPVPELSGQKIMRSEVRVIANAYYPHPELIGQANVAVASTPQSK
jgi:hypothetical protein